MLPFLRPRRPPERLATSFRWLDPRPFPESRAQAYTARYAQGCYLLSLERDSYFAWETLSADRRFSDIVLEADIELDPSNGHSAAGVVLRHVNEESFYCFLVSTRGNWRFDLLVNMNPVHLVEWTRLPEPDGPVRRLRIVAHGSHFSFLVDDEWVGEIDDEVLPAGAIGFAAQNFAGSGRGAFRLRRLCVDARPIAVEKEHLRWTWYFPVPPRARAQLAETLFAMGSIGPAAVQMRKSLKGREGTARERLLLARCYAQLSLHDGALEELRRILGSEPGNREAAREMARVLYLSNRFLEARDLVSAGLADGSLAPDPELWNLLGNAEYALGNWEKAAAAYLKAVEAQPEAPVFLRNAGRSLEMTGRGREALALYLRAARVLFAGEEYAELSLVLPRVLALDPGSADARALEAKVLFHEGGGDEALGKLLALADAGAADSSIHYLAGIALCGAGRREQALPHLARAAEMEPSFPLYHFRLAETLHLLGRDPGEALEKARALAPEDPWICNLAGQILLEEGDHAAALALFQRARDAAPSEADIRLNLSEALSRAGRHDEALAALEGAAADTGAQSRLSNQRGTVRARKGDGEGAVREYEAAMRQDPGNAAYKENCAAACIQIDMVHRAEELLAQLDLAHPSASVYALLGDVAVLKGEPSRAEAAFAAALGLEPENPDLMVSLANLRAGKGDTAQARSLLERAAAAHPGHERARRALDRFRAEHERALSCAACARQWRVPKDLPPQPPLVVRGEPPADAPAGRCPRCGKVLCVACASAHLRGARFHCPDCGEPLKLSDDALRWILSRRVEEAGTRSP